jgi:hypothetical protein
VLEEIITGAGSTKMIPAAREGLLSWQQDMEQFIAPLCVEP